MQLRNQSRPRDVRDGNPLCRQLELGHRCQPSVQDLRGLGHSSTRIEETAKLTSGGDVSWNRNFGRTSRPTAGDVDLRAGYVPLWSIDYVEADLLNANQVLSTIRYFK